MLSSRYAPVVALGALGVVLVLVLGWFLAVSPQNSARSNLVTQTADVEANTQQIELQSAKLDQFVELLAADTSVADSIALNAPASVDLSAFRARVWDALNASRSELVRIETAGSQEIEGWVVPPTLLTSTQVAALFQTGPVAEPGTVSTPEATSTPAADGNASATPGTAGGWTPAVTATTQEGPVAGNILMIPITISIAGTAEEAYRFVAGMSDPDQQLFQVYAVTQEARQSDDAPIPGVADPRDGDVLTTVVGGLYLLNPTGEAIDEDALEEVRPGNGAFNEPGAAPSQRGA